MKQQLIRHRALEATGANASRRILEADEQSLNDRMDAVGCAAREKFKGPDGCYVWVPAVFDTYAIIAKGEDLWRVSYTLDANGECVFGDDAMEVVRKTTYEPEKPEPAELTEGAIFGPMADDAVPVKEGETAAATPVMTGKKWGVVIIQEGMSKNRNKYQRKALQAAAPLYEGAKVFIDHADRGTYGRSIKDQAGFLKGVSGALLGVRESFAAGEKAQGTFALIGTLVVTKPAIRQEMIEAWDEGAQDFFGLSHDAMCDSVLTADTGGRAFYDVQRIESVQSVDLVSNAAAGGRVLRLVASDSVPATLEKDAAMLKKMMEAILASGNASLKSKLEAFGQNPTEDQVMGLYSQIGAAQAVTESAPAAPAATTTTAPAANVRQVSESEWLGVKRDGIALFLENTIGGTSLPDMVKDSLRKKFSAQIDAATTSDKLPSRESVTAEVTSQVELFGRMAEANIVLPSAAGRTMVQSVESRREKIDRQLDAFFGVKKEGERFVIDRAPAMMSFRNVYADITGDVRVTGRTSECTRLTENLTSATFDQVLADAINRRMVADYAMQNQAAWRGTIAEVVPASDFRTQHRVRFGGYGNLPTVTQGSPYTALTSPTDEEATYSVAKRGGTEQLTIEMIANDDVGAVRRIPQKLARSAGQTLYEFAMDFMATNAVIYDSVALIASGHANIVSSALTTSNIAALRLKIKNQADMSNSKRIGLKARYLFVPNDLEELAFYLTQADRAVPDSSVTSTAAAAAPNFVRGQGIQPIVVDYWTDTNDYHLTASVDQAPMIEIAFLGGREEPELFVQDTPNQGSLFTNDVLTYKIRHIYGGAVLDYRGFAAGIV
jgi:hypothetical protein